MNPGKPFIGRAGFFDRFWFNIMSGSGGETPVNITPPSINSGGVGDTLTVTQGVWTGNPTLTYQWLKDGLSIPGETGLTYEIVVGDLGTDISVLEIPNNIPGDGVQSNIITVDAAVGFTFDTTGRINSINQAPEILGGDSMQGTTSNQSWPSGAVPQHPTPIDNSQYEYKYGIGVTEVTSELAGSLNPVSDGLFRGLYPSNSQSQWPKYGNDFFTYTGIKPIYFKCNIGGAEVFFNGDQNNWQPSPTGLCYDYMMDSWNTYLATSPAGITLPLYIRFHLGVNDAQQANGLGQSQQAIRYEAVRTAYIDLISRLQASFGSGTQLRINSIGVSSASGANTAVIAVRGLIEGMILELDDPNVQLDVKPYDYFSRGFYGAVSSTSTTSVSINATTIPSTINITTGLGLFCYVGQAIRIASAANVANRIDGSVLSYNPGTGALSFTATAKNGTGTLTDWNVTSTTDDGIHWTQAGNNAIGADMALYEVLPRFDENLIKGRMPNFTGLGSAGATLNFKILVNFKLAATADVHWAVYPSTDANHTKSEIEAGTGAVAFGTKTTNCMVDDTVSIIGLANNTRYRVQMWAEIGSVESDVYRTVTFRTRTSGNATETNAVLARFSALDAPTTAKITAFVEKCLDYGVWAGIDDVWWNAVNNTADKYISMKGIINPVNLGTNPAFVAGSGLRTTATTAGLTDRLNLQVTEASFPQYLSNDGFYAINFWDDQNAIASGTYRAAFGMADGVNRSTRFGVTYNSSVNKVITYSRSSAGTTLDFAMGSSSIELNKLHIVSKVATQSTTLDAALTIDGKMRNNSVSANITATSAHTMYMFAQNNVTGGGTTPNISARCAMGINFLAFGGASLVDRQYFTLACRELGIGV